MDYLQNDVLHIAPLRYNASLNKFLPAFLGYTYLKQEKFI